ncbi:unnamed protein product [Ambrosiozyma monospora]|uniref:Unnamed protein product n=1 Tax=Ambrosiozyma monospora TaxID=43982 RepID=A0ACB5SR48_AMBMO|nr:unnamed protein product [Ambrosiozyma monospora]
MHRMRYSPEINEIKHFISTLKSHIIILDIEDEAYQPIMQFVNTMFDFLKAAASLKAIPDSQEFDDDRAFFKINVCGFLLNVDKPELLQSLINSMYEKYIDEKNYTQAALSLELLANIYSWNPTSYLPPSDHPHFPSQSEFKRKEALFIKMASNFNKGNKIEQAVETYQELLNAYNKFNFDLKGLSFCHTELATCFNNLEAEGRMESTYFKVAYIGHGFPDSLRGKEFIYEGKPFEHITSINQRINRMYPGARIISSDEEAKKLLASAPFGKYLHVKTVTPQKRSDSMSHLSFTARQYMDNKNLNCFVSHKRIAGSTNVTNLWTEEYTYTSTLTFPTLMNRSEIKYTSVVKLSPIKNAVKALIAKNEELSSLEFMIKQNLRDGIDPQSISSSAVFHNLSRVLAGTVDSPVNGGVGQYRAFFGAQSNEPDFYENVKYLKTSFNNLIILLNKLLKLHKVLVPQHLMPQHQAMADLFTKNFRREIEELKLDVNSSMSIHKLLKSLISTNIFSRRYYQQRLTHASSDLYTSSYTGSTNDEDLSSIFTGSTSSESETTNSNSGSKFSGSHGSSSVNNNMGPAAYRTASNIGNKRTILNMK